MGIYRPSDFQKKDPEASVILPVFAGQNSPHCRRLLAELAAQSFRDFEVLVVEGEEPNGHARNVGVRVAKGRYLVFIDETTSLAGENVIENLLRPLRGDPHVGMSGASVRLYPKATWLEKQYYKIRSFDSPLVDQITESDQVQHPCLAIRKYLYEEVGGESDWLITGTDNDLRQRVAGSGHSMVLVPGAMIYHMPGRNFAQLLKKSFRKGMGSAFAFLVFPGLFETPGVFTGVPGGKIYSGFYKLASAVVKIVHPKFIFNPVGLICEWAVAVGYVAGILKWRYRRPAHGRPDLRLKVK